MTRRPYVLVLGCGRKQTPEHYGLAIGQQALQPDEIDFVTLDADRSVGPQLLCRLGDEPIPIPDNTVDLAVALHLLEHIGVQGETQQWFYFWEEVYRVLRPGGVLQFECPLYSSLWAWADPTHTRAISEHTFTYFNQDAYRHQGSAIPRFRIHADFVLIESRRFADRTNADVAAVETHSMIEGRLLARKPLRAWWEDA